MSDIKGRRAQAFAALLRAVNLGSRNRVPMAELRALAERLGAEDVRTYVQSGNVVFRSSQAADVLAAELHEAIQERFGLDIAVVVRTGAQLAKIAARNPFAGPGVEDRTLHVAFLAETPSRARIRELDPGFAAPDVLRVVGRHVYLHYPNGYGRTKLTNTVLERRLGVAATTRNWRTVTALAELTTR
ncbi:MAG TPA: DUF1697 domain-containing protein [Gaiella sp.]|nr:DUF1697 domain-containing protein [Gaiella sp.]